MKRKMESALSDFVYDVLIIGAGGAGLSASLSAKNKDAKVAVLCESYPTRAQTSMAQGGINASLGNAGKDSINSHIEDTLKSSGEIGQKEMISKMCEDAPTTAKWLESIGMPYSRTDEGKIAQRKLGGTSSSRACYAQDFTGLKILHTLYDQCLKEDIEFLNEKFLLEFVVENNIIKGAICLDIRTTEVEFIKAKSIIVASGGFCGLYYNFTTNTDGSTGDGIAAALRAGARLSNMEFIQFHPTGLKKSGILISESARGAGGYLVNEKGERFTDELGPRDKVSRAIFDELKDGGVYLDIRHLGEEYIDEHMPQERKLAITYEGIDPVSELIPISPVAHYSMGGICVDANLMSLVDGLFGVGECSESGVHGANRLGGNSLLEIVSFGKLAGENCAKFSKDCDYKDADAKHYESAKRFIEEIYEYENREDFYENREDFYENREFLGELFYKKAGIIREEKELKEALVEVKKMQKNYTLMGLGDRSRVYNTNLVEFIKFKNTLTLGKALLISAIKREESRGAHFRSDFPNTDESFKQRSFYNEV
jgi:succinate dehydrogenase / fumarate reductase flavoprotein subunit